jgi:HEAT repeat protein
MADATTKKLLELLGPDHPAPVRCAAAVVLGEVGSKDGAVAGALCAALDDPELTLRLDAAEAVGKLKIDRALPKLLARVKEGGGEAETAAQAAAHIGARGIKALRGLMGEASPVLRRRIASALAAGGSAAAETAAVDALLHEAPGVVNAAVRTLSGQVPSMSPAERRGLADHLLDLLTPRKTRRLPQTSEAAMLRVLAALGDPRGAAVFWAHAEPAHPPEVRSAALQALGTLAGPINPAQLKRLLASAADPDFRVAAPALMILRNVPVPDRALKDWLPLLDAADVGVRNFAVEKLGDKDHPDVADGLLRQLKHSDRNLRHEALGRLAGLGRGREALGRALLEAESPDEAWSLARVQAPFVKDYPASLRNRLFAQACDNLEDGDRRADALLFLLRERNAADLRDRLAERALALRKKKQYEKGLIYLRLLGRDPALGEATRFELAASGLKVSTHDLAAESRAADPSLSQFARLVTSHETDPAEYVRKARWLEPEDLFYLGFHFVEGKGPERDFGATVLKLLAQRSPRSKVAKDAKAKLRSAGLA